MVELREEGLYIGEIPREKKLERGRVVVNEDGLNVSLFKE